MNEPAFPQLDPNGNQWWGLTKRELFAAMAMAGLLANENRSGTFDDYARDAVAQTDVLIAELEKGEQR